MRARPRGVRSHAHGLTVAGATALLLLVTACGGGSGGSQNKALDSQDSGAVATESSPTATTAAGAAGRSANPAAKGGAAASTSASAPAQQSSGAAKAAGGGGGSGSGGSATTAPSAAAPRQETTAIKVNAKCRKPASSVGSGVALKGQRPPGFTATTVDCGSLDFEDYTKGKPTLVTFFAAWCEPCHKEAKDLEEVYEKYHSKGFTVVGVDTDDESGNPSWFYDTAHWTFPSVWDDEEKIKKAWNSTGVISTLPASFWIHPDGTISSTIIGEMSRSQMEDEYNKL